MEEGWTGCETDQQNNPEEQPTQHSIWSPSLESADLRLLHWLEAGQTADKRGRELGFESKPLSTPSLQSSSSTTFTSVKGGICSKTVTLPLNSTPSEPKPMSAPPQ